MIEMHEEKQIRECWFKNHIASITQHGELTVLDWKNPANGHYHVRYVFDGHRLYITGDIGEAVFNLTWKADVHSFTDVTISYFMEKMSAFSDDRYDFSTDKAANRLEEWKGELLESGDYEDEAAREKLCNTIDKLIQGVRSCNSEEKWAFQYVNGEFHEFISSCDADYWEWIYHIGRAIPMRVRGYLIGLQMASNQLKAREIADKVRDNQSRKIIMKREYKTWY